MIQGGRQIQPKPNVELFSDRSTSGFWNNLSVPVGTTASYGRVVKSSRLRYKYVNTINTVPGLWEDVSKIREVCAGLWGNLG